MTILTKSMTASAIFALLAICSQGTLNAQQNPAAPPSAQQKALSEQELRSFAKAYVKTQKLSEEYEAASKQSRDPQENAKLKQQATAKAEKALQEEGLTVESFKTIFAMVNADENMRNRTLQLIEEERKGS